MSGIRIGYAHCSTDKQDLAVQHAAFINLGVAEDRIYKVHGLIGMSWDLNRPKFVGDHQLK